MNFWQNDWRFLNWRSRKPQLKLSFDQILSCGTVFKKSCQITVGCTCRRSHYDDRKCMEWDLISFPWVAECAPRTRQKSCKGGGTRAPGPEEQGGKGGNLVPLPTDHLKFILILWEDHSMKNPNLIWNHVLTQHLVSRVKNVWRFRYIFVAY